MDAQGDESFAQSLYAGLLLASPSPTEAELDDLCARHPGEAQELRGLHRVHASLAALGSAGAPSGKQEHSKLRVGTFECVRLLGRGGVGEVWEALDRALDRRVALKLLTGAAELSERQRERFRREALAASRVRHPNVVTLYTAGEADGRLYLVQELVVGGRTLRDEIEEQRRAGSPPPGHDRRTAERFAALADALAVAHEAGVVHRDVKPQNVLLEADGAPKLADFGLAKQEGDASLSHTGEFVGTYLYASPEQVAPGAVEPGPASDVFSLGATLYESLTLARPFGGDSARAIARDIQERDPPDPRVLRARIPDDLAVICTKALEKRPEHRFASAAEMRDDLRRFLAREPIRARPPSRARRVQRWTLRHPTASTAIALSCAAFAAMLALFLRAERARAETQAVNEKLLLSNDELVIARANADSEVSASREVVGFLSGLFRAADPSLYGRETPSLRQLVERGAERLRSGAVTDPRARARLMTELGVLHLRLGSPVESAELLQQACESFREMEALDSLPGIQARAGYAHALFTSGRAQAARDLVEPLVARWHAERSLDEPTAMIVLCVLGIIQAHAGEVAAGEAHLLEALELAGKTEEALSEHTIRMELSVAYLRQGRLPEAEALLRASLVELDPLIDAGNTVALEVASRLGAVLQTQGRLEEAEAILERSLAATDSALGSDSLRSVSLRINLALVRQDQRRWNDAEELLRAALAICATNANVELPDCMSARANLATLLARTERTAEAAELLRAVIEDRVRTIGENHIDTAFARANLAFCLHELGRSSEAVELQRLAVAAVNEGVEARAGMLKALERYERAAAEEP